MESQRLFVLAMVLLSTISSNMVTSQASTTAASPADRGLLAEQFLSADRHLKCQRLKSRYGSMCADFGYNMTSMPNLLNHQKQREAYAHLQGYSQLIESGCSSELTFLLCAFHFPMCSLEMDAALSPTLITPCRGVCERVRSDCLPTMQRYGFQWPEQMQCERLQETQLTTTREGDRVVCVDRPSVDAVTAPPTCGPVSCDTIKMKKKTFTQGKYHFALEGTYFGGFLLNDRKELQVRVTRAHHFCNEVPSDVTSGVAVGNMISLRTDATNLCMCPDLEVGHTYLFTGYLGPNGRLYLDSRRSVMTTLKNPAKQVKRVKKWMKKLCKKFTPYQPVQTAPQSTRR